MNTPLLYSIVPIAPSKTMTCCGSRSRAMSGFSGNGGLRFSRSAGAGATNCVVLRLGMMDDHRGSRLFRQQLECLGEVHAKRFLCGKELEHGGVVVKIRTGTVPPRVPLSTRHP